MEAQIKLKIFVDQDKRSQDLLEVLKEFDVTKEIIKVDTGKGKKLCKEWCVFCAPHLFFVSNDKQERMFYSDNTTIEKSDIKSIIKSLEKKWNKRIIITKGEENNVDEILQD